MIMIHSADKNDGRDLDQVYPLVRLAPSLFHGLTAFKVDVYQILYGKNFFFIFEVFILFNTLKHGDSNGYYSFLKL